MSNKKPQTESRSGAEFIVTGNNPLMCLEVTSHGASKLLHIRIERWSERIPIFNR